MGAVRHKGVFSGEGGAVKKHKKMLEHIFHAHAKQGRAAREDHGVSRPRQLGEMLLLRLGRGKLRPEEYYKLRLYRDDMSFAEKRTYASNAALPRSLFGGWEIVADDKLLTYGILGDAGLTIPKIYAVCHGFRRYREQPTLATVPDIAAYLRTDATFPRIAKPVGGIYSQGVYLLEGLDAAGQSVLLEGEPAQPVETLAAQFLATKSGYLFQELLRPHAEIRRLVGSRLCTLRVIVLLKGNRPSLYMAILKLNASDHVADNYWRDGNMLARLDQETGEVQQCMAGLGPKLRTVDTHQRTGAPLTGFRVPDYKEAIEVALRASRSFPGIPMQAWDVALTDNGPVALEVNIAGNLFGPQLVTQKGLWTDSIFRGLCEGNKAAVGEGV